MSERYYGGRKGKCVCGGKTVRILKKNPLRVCTTCRVGTIPKNQKKGESSKSTIFVSVEDVPKILSGTHKINEDGDVVPVKERDEDHTVPVR